MDDQQAKRGGRSGKRLPVRPPHVDIAELFRSVGERLGAVGRADHAVAFDLEEVAQEDQGAGFVVHDQDGGDGGGGGSVHERVAASRVAGPAV